MSRLLPKMNIETDIFNEEEEQPSYNYFEATVSDYAQKQKGTIMIESLLTSLYLRKIYLPFRIITTAKIIRSYSSKDLRIYKSHLRHEDEQIDETHLHVASQKKSTSMNRNQTERSFQILRESRKMILENINEKLKENQISRIKEKEQEIVNKKIKRLQKLRQNICQQKTKSYIPTKVHERKNVTYVPKKQKHQQMNAFLAQLQELKKEVTEIKEMNEIILSSRVNSQKKSIYQSQSKKSKSPFSNYDNEATYQIGNKTTIKKQQFIKNNHSPGYTKPQLMRELGLKPMPESNQSISSFRLIDNEENQNRLVHKTTYNESSFIYSKSSERKEVQRFELPSPKVLFRGQNPKSQQMIVHRGRQPPSKHAHSQFIQTTHVPQVTFNHHHRLAK